MRLENAKQPGDMVEYPILLPQKMNIHIYDMYKIYQHICVSELDSQISLKKDFRDLHPASRRNQHNNYQPTVLFLPSSIIEAEQDTIKIHMLQQRETHLGAGHIFQI